MGSVRLSSQYRGFIQIILRRARKIKTAEELPSNGNYAGIVARLNNIVTTTKLLLQITSSYAIEAACC